MHSGIYRGTIRHRRFKPHPHDFNYHLFMMLLDLEELDAVFNTSTLWSLHRPNLAWFKRSDYLGDPEISLDLAIRDLVEHHAGYRPLGRIALLTQLRYFGFIFNPVSFYYCYDPSGTKVETIVAEITNTPWKERHPYILSRDLDEPMGSMHRYRFQKDFHVSPFFPMDMDYDWRFSQPAADLHVHMRLDQVNSKQFDASLRLKREEIDSKSLAKILLTYPFMTLKVISGIYLEAFHLKRKGIPVHPHPGTSSERHPP
jgi:uncharacterized protein